MVSETYGNSAEAALKCVLQVPKDDPAPLAAATTRPGVAATMSTLAYPPFKAGAALFDARPHRGRAVRLEHRHVGRRHRGAEFGLDKLRRVNSAMIWPTYASIWAANCSTHGTRTRW
jgi:hypothetical protein